MDHLFCSGAWGRAAWNFMHNVFGISRPHCIDDISRRWIGSKHPTSLLGGARIGLTCYIIWEIWHARNANIHEGRVVNIIREALQWLNSARKLIKLPHDGGRSSVRRLFCLGISSYIPSRHKWRAWTPSSSGWTINVAVLASNNISKIGYIIRDCTGDLKTAGTAITCLHGLHALVWAFAMVISRSICIGLWPLSIQSSNIFLGELLFGKEEEMDADAVYACRSFRRDYSNIAIRRINAAQNGAALAICFKGEGVFSCFSELPIEAQRVIIDDSTGLPRPSPAFHSDSSFGSSLHRPCPLFSGSAGFYGLEGHPL